MTNTNNTNKKVKFTSLWEVIEKPRCMEHIDPSEPSNVEKTPQYDTGMLLRSILENPLTVMNILGYDGFDDEQEEAMLENPSALCDRYADAVDRLEEAETVEAIERQRASSSNKQAQADTNFKKETNSPSKSSEAGFDGETKQGD